MSADNWARCPKCLKEGEASFAKQQIEVDEAYGKVSIEEFDRQRAELAKAQEFLDEDDTFRTFREDYEFSGAEEGVVTASYKGQCTKCGLSLKFEEKHPIPGLWVSDGY